MRDVLATIPIVLLLPALLLPFLAADASVGGTLIASPAELAVLPTSGSAWTNLKGVADGPLGTADLGGGNTTAAGARRETERADRPGVNELGSTSSPPAPRSGPFQDRLNRGSRVRIYGSD